MLVPVFIYLVCLSAHTDSEAYRYAALIIFLLAALTDFFDGYLARKLKQETPLGRILDVAADKLLIISAVVIFTFLKGLPLRLPYWAAAAILTRDIFVITGAVWLYFKVKKPAIKPNILGKIGITVEMLMIASILLLFEYSFLLWQAAVVLAVGSAVVYVNETRKILKGGLINDS